MSRLCVLWQCDASTLTKTTCCMLVSHNLDKQNWIINFILNWPLRDTFCTCMNKLKQSNRGYPSMTALICCLLLMAGWYGCGPAPLHGLMCLVSTLLSFLLYIHFSDSLFDSVKPNNQSKWCLSLTVGHGASVCKICFTTTFQWCGTPVWPGISMPIALSKSPDSWGLCAVTLILPLWFKWPLTKTQTVVKTKTFQFQVITRDAVLQGASPWIKPPQCFSD